MDSNSELTKEEAKIINMMTEGHTHKAIAARIGKTLDYVANTITAIKKRHGCRSSVQLIAKLFREELLIL